jgi:hypothetical protein
MFRYNNTNLSRDRNRTLLKLLKNYFQRRLKVQSWKYCDEIIYFVFSVNLAF